MKGKKIHCIGIGGIGLSALAQLLKSQGAEVSGCDRGASPVTEQLEKSAVVVSIGHDESHVTSEIDLLIYSDAIPADHPERMKAAELAIPQKSYFEALGEIANQYKCLIAIAGAHGKTSTTAMMIDVLEAGGLDLTAIVGSLRAKTKSNFRAPKSFALGQAGSKDYFIVEADEYMRHFLNFVPRILVITNVDADHLDYYKDLADVQSAFRALAEKVPADGYIVCDLASEKVAPILKDLKCTIVDYQKYFDPQLPMKALPLQRINASAVLAVADILTIDQSVAKKALGEFSGTWRRFEYLGKNKNGAEVYDDYGHHPKEISLTLSSIREAFPGRKIVVAFQPHLYSRTKLLLTAFMSAFEDADEVLIAPIFAAREDPDPTVSSEILADRIREHGGNATALPNLDMIQSKLAEYGEGTLIVTMGAGELYKVAQNLIK